MTDPDSSDISLEDSQDETKEDGQKKELQSEHEYLSDSSSDSILQFRNEQEMKQKEEEVPIRVLEAPPRSKMSFELNGMKVTVRKRPSHKRKAVRLFVYLYKYY